MKKIISYLLLITVLSLGLSLTAFANDGNFTISEDYKSITLDGVTYIRTNAAAMLFYELYELDREPALTETQSQELAGSYFNMDSLGDVIEAEFYFPDGATLTASYLREGYLEEFTHWTTGDDIEYEIDFYWPDGNIVPVTAAQLKGNPVTLEGSKLYWADTYDVAITIADDSRYVQRGKLIIDENSYYYVDYPENPQLSMHGYYDISECDYLSVYEITDQQILKELDEAKESSETGTQILSSESFGNKLSAVMMSLLFGFIPLGMLILTGILTIRSKGSYRVIWGVTAGFAVVTLVIYISFVIQLFLR